MVVIHGGYWSSSYGAELGRPLAADLVSRGFAALNVEYRRVGDGGGWLQTGQDVAAGVDALQGSIDQSRREQGWCPSLFAGWSASRLARGASRWRRTVDWRGISSGRPGLVRRGPRRPIEDQWLCRPQTSSRKLLAHSVWRSILPDVMVEAEVIKNASSSTSLARD